MKRTIEILNSIFEKIKGRLLKYALFKIFGKVIGGFWGFLATEIGGRLIDKVIKPIYKYTIRKIYVAYKARQFKKSGEKVEEAKNENEFDDSFDDLN